MSSSPYQPAASLLTKLWKGKKSLNSLVFDLSGDLNCSKTTYAQVCQVQKHRTTLKQVIKTQEKDWMVKNEALLYVLLYELLLGPHQSIMGGGQLKRQVMKREEELRRTLGTLQSNQQDANDNSKYSMDFPRYVRVNTCRARTRDVVEQIKSIVPSLYLDRHVPDLLVLPPKSTTLLKSNQQLSSNSIVLQDKSSSFPALCLARGFPDPTIQSNGAFLDACAAPGNKTTHLAALLGDSSTPKSNTAPMIYALDRDPERHKLLARRTQELVPGSQIVTQQKDFLATTSSDFPTTIQGILLDPTCSGSGMATRDHAGATSRSENENDDDRLFNLSHFQSKALLHACTAFPEVQRIVYSTCSVHTQENESVVAKVLEQCKEDWQVVAPVCLTTWKRRGQVVEGLTPEQAQCMIRVDAQHDETNGFFVCCLQRIPSTTTKEATTKKSDNPERDQKQAAEQYGLELYRGEFAITQRDISPKLTKTTKKRSNMDSESSSTKGKAKKSKVEDTTQSTETVDAASVRKNKKRMKKNEWKKQQKKQKMERLGKKKVPKKE